MIVDGATRFRSPLGDGMGVRTSVAALVIALALAVASPAALAAAAGGKQILTRAMGWEIELTAKGGLTEGGIGGFRLRSTGEAIAGRGSELECHKHLDEPVVSRIDREISATRPSEWPSTFTSAAGEAKGADVVTYELKFTRQGPRAATHTTSWTDLEAGRLPAALIDLVKDLDALKTSVLAACD
ncbi:MAG TPA: hypothetical protein VKA53_07020 [Thermoanaerobaculia bacterium]|nr:hypothetical protein [Thermoanaerobaculia bacterium]